MRLPGASLAGVALLVAAPCWGATFYYPSTESSGVTMQSRCSCQCNELTQANCDETTLPSPLQRKMTRFKPLSGGNAQVSVTKDVTGQSGMNALVMVLRSPPLATQEISGDLTVLFPASQSLSTANASLFLHVWVSQGSSTSAHRCTLLANHSTVPDEFYTVATCRGGISIPLSSCNIFSGDRVIVEVAVKFSTTGAPRSATLYHGGSGENCPSIADGDSTSAPILRFSDDIEELDPTPTNTPTVEAGAPTPSRTPTNTPTLTGVPSTPTPTITCAAPEPTDTVLPTPTRTPQGMVALVFGVVPVPTPTNRPGCCHCGTVAQCIEPGPMESCGECVFIPNAACVPME